MRRDIALQTLFPDAVADEDVIIPGSKKPDPQAEWRLQCKCVKHLRRAMKDNPLLRYIAAQPESPRSPQRAEMAKRMGLQPGIADLILLYGKNSLRIAWVELKRPGKKLSDAQQDWADWMRRLGVEVHRCDSIEQFRSILAAFAG